MANDRNRNSTKAHSTKDKQRMKELFDKLDVDKNGKIEVKELAQALSASKIASGTDANSHAEAFMSRADKDKSSDIDIHEFIAYMEEHEHKLRLAFSTLDKNQDGKIEPTEIQAALNHIGIIITIQEAEALTKKLDANSDATIDWDEWHQFFLLVPVDSLAEMTAIWRRSAMIDTSDDFSVPPEFTEEERKTGLWWRHLVAGGLAGVVSRTCTAPLDRLKVMMQVQGASGDNTMASAFRQMIAEGGWRSLWRGNGTNVVKIAPASAIKFYSYELFKRLIVGDRKRPIDSVERFVAGALAGAISQTAIYPLEVVKTRLNVMETGQYRGIFDCALQMARTEGLRSLYKGYVPNIVGILPYAGIDLSVYEALKQAWMNHFPNVTEPSITTMLLCGGISSTCGQLCTYPLALVRTKLQASPDITGKSWHLLSDILRTEGFRGWYSGFVANTLKVVPSVGISYVVYEHAKSQMGIPN